MKYDDIPTSASTGLISAELYRKYPFQRFPQKYEDSVRKEVWELSENSAGVSVCFTTNSNMLSFKWSVKNNLKMNHMTDVGIKGLDIYQYVNDEWGYLSSGLPKTSDNEHSIKLKNKNIDRKFCIYLPLYDTLTKLSIGINSDSRIKYFTNKRKPIVFYGTSITQGGCASRPGLVHTNIISRKIGYPSINLGFSGNGHLETRIGEILSTIHAKCFVIDCLPNVNISQIKSNVIPLVKSIRSTNKSNHCPIIFIEQPLIHDQYIEEDVKKKNYLLANQIKECNKLGFKEIHLLDQVNSLGSDNEATVDGVHYNDIGFLRFARHIYEHIEKLIQL